MRAGTTRSERPSFADLTRFSGICVAGCRLARMPGQGTSEDDSATQGHTNNVIYSQISPPHSSVHTLDSSIYLTDEPVRSYQIYRSWSMRCPLWHSHLVGFGRHLARPASHVSIHDQRQVRYKIIDHILILLTAQTA